MTTTSKVEVWLELSATTGDVLTLDDTVKGELDEATYPLGGTTAAPVDITAYVYGFGVTRGRDRELDEINAGTATVSIRNHSGEFTPDGFIDRWLRDDDGVILTDDDGVDLTIDRLFAFDSIDVGRRVRISANGVTIFDGNIDDWSFTFDVNGDALAQFVAVDALANLAAMELAAHTATGSQTAGPRLTAVLDRAEVAYSSNRSIGTGISVLAADAVSEATNALNYCQLVAGSDRGRLFASRDGVLTFKDRHAVVNPTPTVAFADDGTGVDFVDLQTGFGSELLYNRVGVTGGAGGASVQTVENATSQAKYRIRALSLGVLVDSDAQALDMAQWLSNVYGAPQARISSITVAVDALSGSDAAGVLGLDLADTVTVEWSPPGTAGSWPEARPMVVEGVTHSKSFDSVHLTVVRLSPVFQSAAFILDDTELGVLDSGVLAF